MLLKASQALCLEWFFSAALGRLSESVSGFPTKELRSMTGGEVSQVPKMYPLLSVDRSLQGCKMRLGKSIKYS